MIVNNIKTRCLFHQVADMKTFGHLGVLRAVFLVPTFYYRIKFTAGYGVCGCEERYVYSIGNQPFGNIGCNLLLGPVMSRRSSPGNRGQNSYPHSVIAPSICIDFIMMLIVAY